MIEQGTSTNMKRYVSRWLLAVATSIGLASLLTAHAAADISRKSVHIRTNFRSAPIVAGIPRAKLARRQVTHPRKATRHHGKRHLARSRIAGMRACRNAAHRFGVPVSTALAVCRLESSFRCSAVGRAGELGLLQIKLSTARAIGYRGSRRGLLTCSTGAYWGMKHLAMAIRRGGIWKHNQGLFARRPTRAARLYARKVAALRRHYR